VHDDTRDLQGDEGMDGERLDALARGLAEAAASRRTLVGRTLGGGLGLVLAAVGLGAPVAEDAEARKHHRHKRHRRKKRGNSGGGGNGGNGGGGGGTGTQRPGFPILGTDPINATCGSGLDCRTGSCINVVAGIGICAPCDLIHVCAGGTQCCVVGATCDPELNACVLAGS